MIPFVKTHALGNDFILVDQNSCTSDYPALARRICHRHFGIGADGLILWSQAGDIFKLRIFNCDGSEAESSGNGLRCTAAHLIESGRWPGEEIRLETVAGIYTLKRVGNEFEADMGEPSVSSMINYPMKVNNHNVAITVCSTGNPHCSLFVEELDETEVNIIGPLLENHSLFPNRTNVEFIHVLNRKEIEVAFWERGVGPTYASGTGSCGATVACVLNEKTDRQITVHTKAGTLRVEWPENGRLKLTSTANIVAEGQYLE